MKTVILTFLLSVNFYTAHTQQCNADELLDMLSLPEAKVESTLKKKRYLYAGEERKGDTVYTSYTVRSPYAKRKKELPDRIIRIARIHEDFVLIYNTTNEEDFIKIKASFEKKHYSVTKLFEDCPPSFLFFQSKAHTITSRTFLQDTITYYSFFFHKKKLPEKHTILFAEDLLQFNSHEYLAAVFGMQNLNGGLYYFSDDQVNKCSVLFPNTPIQAVFIWKDELHQKELISVIIGGRDEMKKPSERYKESIISENKWRFRNNAYIGMSLLQLRKAHGESFEIFASNSKYTGLIKSNTGGKIAFYRHNYIMGCLNCNQYLEFQEKELIKADDAIRKGLLLFLLCVTLLPEEKTTN